MEPGPTGEADAKAVYNKFAGPGIIYPAKIPKGPTLFTQVKLGAPLTEDNAILARRFWQEPDAHLQRAWEAHTNRPYTRAKNDKELDLHVLAHNVYEHLMSNPFLPVSREDAMANWSREGLNETYDGIQGLGFMRENIFVDGRNVQNPEAWTVAMLKKELMERNLSLAGKKAELQERLWLYEIDQRLGLLKQSNLDHWGIARTNRPILSPATNEKLTALDMYTAAIALSPYNPTYWTSRAYCHYLQGFFDLAIGDAYRAEVLCEVLTTAFKRNRQPGLYTRVWDAVQMHLMAEVKITNAMPPEIIRMRGPNGINYFIPTLRNAIHNITSLSLAAMNCWEDFEIQMEQHEKRNLFARDSMIPSQRKIVVQPIIEEMRSRKAKPTADHPSLYGHEWMQVWVSGETRYPYEQVDVNREAAAFISALNTNVFTTSEHAEVKTSCEVRSAGLRDGSSNGLGVFAKSGISKGTVIHYEEPVLRGHLQPNILGDDRNPGQHTIPRCDNCKRVIPPAQVAHLRKNWPFITGTTPNVNGAHHPLNCLCLDQISTTSLGQCNDSIPVPLFCIDNQIKRRQGGLTCKAIASQLYAFPEFSRAEWGWLQDTMRANIQHHQAGDFYVSHHEKQGTILSLLLKNVLEITLHRREQDPDLLAHEINELLVLENGTDANKPWSQSWFPFTMSGNIRVPFDILGELGVNIFRDLSFDTWVLQIVLRKLHINAAPWDPARRANTNPFTQFDGPKSVPVTVVQEKMKATKSSFSPLEPSFSNLYLFPGLSMFNHACRGSENATWGFDTTVPNRLIIYATKDIASDEEIRVPYQNLRFPSVINDAPNGENQRLLGKNCNCDQCTGYKSTDEGESGSKTVGAGRGLTAEAGSSTGAGAGVFAGFAGIGNGGGHKANKKPKDDLNMRQYEIDPRIISTPVTIPPMLNGWNAGFGTDDPRLQRLVAGVYKNHPSWIEEPISIYSSSDEFDMEESEEESGDVSVVAVSGEMEGSSLGDYSMGDSSDF